MAYESGDTVNYNGDKTVVLHAYEDGRYDVATSHKAPHDRPVRVITEVNPEKITDRETEQETLETPTGE